MSELDGSQLLEQAEQNREPTEFLESKSYRVLRFWDQDVMTDVDVVLKVISASLNDQERGLPRLRCSVLRLL
jgi:very-short-patch-repair endonuclease